MPAGQALARLLAPPATSSKQKMSASKSLLLNITIFLLVALVFGLDQQVQLGMAVWLFYMVPVMLAANQRRPDFPPLVALTCMVLIWVAFLLATGDNHSTFTIINRSMGCAALAIVGGLGWQAIRSRMRADTLFWIEQGRTGISPMVMGDKEEAAVAQSALDFLVKYTNARAGVLYVMQEQGLLPRAWHAVQPLPDGERALAPGEGLVGETMRQQAIRLESNLPDSYLDIASGSGRSAATHVILVPLTSNQARLGVLELAYVRKSDDFARELELLELVREKIAVGLRSAKYRANLQNLLEETQRQSEELQSQAEELRVVNEELQESGRAMQQSQAQLEMQQSDLEQLNSDLEERTRALEEQRAELLESRQRSEQHAAALERANRYKSEFLANMSHELRTPLNSSLILAHMLAQNKPGNLTPDQVRYAGTIHAANSDLLNLINDILDLSRIEAGHMRAELAPLSTQALLEQMRAIFEPVAAQKSLSFTIEVTEQAPQELHSDEMRLLQVLKNLLANAFKFTHEGEVRLRVARGAGDHIEFTVSDTGIGIAPDQQEVIFEAFRQADGSTNRNYGGTGLGLSISRQLAHLLGGDISVASQPGQGSHFTLTIPRQAKAGTILPREGDPALPANAVAQTAPTSALTSVPNALAAPAPQAAADPKHEAVADDRGQRKRSRLIMAVEDDNKFAEVLRELAHEMDFDFLHAVDGASAQALALEYQPDAMLLDVRLPDSSGMALLERFKRQSELRHIPMHMISVDDYRHTALELGAIGYSLKPVARDDLAQAIRKLDDMLKRSVKRLLVVEDNPELRNVIAAMIGREGIETVEAGTAAEALQQLKVDSFDCVILDLKLPDGSGFHVLEQMAEGGAYSFPPVIIYTGRQLTAEEEQRLRRYSESIIVKGARSPERLLDEVSLFLHQVESRLPAEQRRMLASMRQREAVFERRKILLAEDDVRNVFALSSIFDPLGAELVVARNGREALQKLEQHPDIAMVLMDVMMPEMDGLSATRAIRAQALHRKLPIIALTAKAMPDDRAECLAAGANDYIAKPLDVEKLVSLCRVWLPR